MRQVKESESIGRTTDETLGRVSRRLKRASDNGDAVDGALPGEGKILVAEGDSWFDFPGTDVLEDLEDLFGYDVRSVAHRGDTMEAMAYTDGQHDQLVRCMQKIHGEGKIPAAILLSGGGNDLAGENLGILLNHYRSNAARESPVDGDILRRLIHNRLRAAFERLITYINRYSQAIFHKRIPVLIHGYACPVPDGRKPGPWILGWIMPGPWLEPMFERKGHTIQDRNTKTMARIVKEFNSMLREMANGDGELSHVRHVDVLECLANTGDYDLDWNGELHPTEAGFERIARKFHSEIARTLEEHPQ